MTPLLPAARFLVPDPTGQPPEGFTRVESRLSTGVPHGIGLGPGERLLLVAPTGVAGIWRSSAPSVVVSEAEAERQPRIDGAPLVLPPLGRVPFRLLYQVDRRTLAVAPLVAGTICRLPEAGEASARVEVMILDWRLHAGTLRGAGDFGSFVALAWRSAALGLDTFSDPLPNPVFVSRQPPARRLQSRVGLTARTLRVEKLAAWKAHVVLR